MNDDPTRPGPPHTPPPPRTDRHVGREHVVRTEMGRQSPSVLAHLVHRHVVELCPVCRDEWRALAGERERFLDLLDRVAVAPGGKRPDKPDPTPPLITNHLPANEEDLAAMAAELERHKSIRKRAIRELWILRRRPPERWAATVDRANTRYRSRAFAELLIETSREVVRTRPLEAARLAGLVPAVLRKRFPPSRYEWSAILVARAEGHRANALRIAGDLAAAARGFADLRHFLAVRDLDDPATLAEAASLEASLAIGQRRFAHAEELLDQAVLLYRHVGDRLGEARALVQQGMALHESARPAEALNRLARAAARFHPAEQPYLYLSTVNSRVACLCDLGRFAEAGELLAAHLDLYDESDDLHVGSVLRDLQGRVALGLGRYAEAEEAFASSRDGLLAVGRTYDAALAALDLACVYVEAGRTADLHALARGLVPTFRARGVSREALGALALVARAVAADALTRELLAEARSRLQASSAPAASDTP